MESTQGFARSFGFSSTAVKIYVLRNEFTQGHRNQADPLSS